MRSIASLLFLLAPLTAQTDLYVGPGGYVTIAEAAAQARDGDRIILRADSVLRGLDPSTLTGTVRNSRVLRWETTGRVVWVYLAARPMDVSVD